MTQAPYGDPNQPPAPDEQRWYPPPVDPFHTMAQPASPPPAYPPGQPYPATPAPTSGSGYPGLISGPGYPAPAPGYPTITGYEQGLGAPRPPAPPKKSRGLMITMIVLGVAVLLCGGGGTAAYLVLRGAADGPGAASPQVAVNDFLVAVYTDHDAEKAGRLVCADARDNEQLIKKIDEIRGYADNYEEPRFSWPEPIVAEANESSAKVNVKVRITTGDEKTTEQQLDFTVIKKTGWFVCEVRAGS